MNRESIQTAESYSQDSQSQTLFKERWIPYGDGKLKVFDKWKTGTNLVRPIVEEELKPNIWVWIQQANHSHFHTLFLNPEAPWASIQSIKHRLYVERTGDEIKSKPSKGKRRRNSESDGSESVASPTLFY